MSNQNRIREVRKAQKLSGPEVAAKIGISTQYLYDIERGKRGLSAEIAGKLSDILRVTTDYLLRKTDENLYEHNRNTPDSHEESELAEIPIEKLNSFKLSYKGTVLSKEESEDLIKLMEMTLKRWKS
ncbi:helix-turn-helix domain-containing protein [Brevibacillus parabrevis]|uniref:helix-turn-helix domain-containing protein n=1 Tax=Brevibacillus parabrevis TaxID=54914 RepID=UPI002853537D|nr:helix-turn-helix transcriptional regulator [Brevibacillus parabrevis]MDR4997862.1 helix-turn-helix transcriptional regulator [Brevibacillus parabrevis]